MNLNLSMSSRKSRGELAAIFARLPAKNQPALLLALRAVVSTLHLATGHRKLFATHTPADPVGLAPPPPAPHATIVVTVTSLLAMSCAHV